MKNQKKTFALLLLVNFAVLLNGQDYQLSPFINNPICSMLRQIGNSCIYFGASVKKDTLRTGLFLTLNQDSTNILLLENIDIDFLDWINYKSIAFFKEYGDTNKLIIYNIEDKRIVETSINNRILNGNKSICYNDSMFVFAVNKNGLCKVFKYLLGKSPTNISGLDNIDIRKVAYNRKNDLLAFSTIEKHGNDSIHIFFFANDSIYKLNDNIGKLWDVVEDIYCFSTNSENLVFYYLSDVKGQATIKKYDFQNQTISELYKLPKGVKCTDITSYGQRLYLTLNEDIPGVLEGLFSGSINATFLGTDMKLDLSPNRIYELSPK